MLHPLFILPGTPTYCWTPLAADIADNVVHAEQPCLHRDIWLHLMVQVRIMAGLAIPADVESGCKLLVCQPLVWHQTESGWELSSVLRDWRPLSMGCRFGQARHITPLYHSVTALTMRPTLLRHWNII